MTLLDVSGQVQGAGTLAPTPKGSVGLAVTGSFIAPAFAATLESGAYPNIVLSGTLADDGLTINATISGAGFSGQSVALAKE